MVRFRDIGLCICLILSGCSDEPLVDANEVAATSDTMTMTAKADLPWSNEGLSDAWRSALTCATAFGAGASDAAIQFREQIWRLPGIIVSLVRSVGEELIRRERDLLMSLSDEDARARVRETAENDLHRVRALLSYLRRAIPTIWSSLEDGTEWFDTLQRDEKVQFVCEVTGRVAFEALVLIAVDKGFSKLTALTRLQVVSGVQTQATRLYNAGRLTYITRKSIRQVGERMAGQRLARLANPGRRFAALGTLESYRAIEDGAHDALDTLIDIARPAIAVVDESGEVVQLLIGEAQWSTTAGNGWIDLFLPSTDTAPEGSVMADDGFAPEVVHAVIQTFESNPSEWPEQLTDMMSNGTRFIRYYVPADTVRGPIHSELQQAIDEYVQALTERLEMPVTDALNVLGEFIDRTPEQRLELLKDFVAEATTTAEDPESSEAFLDDFYVP